ncbi:MAG: cytochrome c [Gammaproteobacteria bacterium]|nr:cytochrome c [Gammaproteobacteria bacterium]
MFKQIVLLGALAVSGAALADESKVHLKDGAGKDVVLAKCTICHSPDYISMNSVFQDKKGWEGTVNKMVKVMGAPVNEQEFSQIVDYLTKYYGKE